MNHCTHGVMGLSLTLVTQGPKYRCVWACLRRHVRACEALPPSSHSVEYASSCMHSFVREFHDTVSSWTSEEFQAQVHPVEV